MTFSKQHPKPLEQSLNRSTEYQRVLQTLKKRGHQPHLHRRSLARSPLYILSA